MTLYLSRLVLNHTASASALIPLLNPREPKIAAVAHHHLIWTVFSDSRDRNRDFLWRLDGRGRFFTLSHRPPRATELFEPPETKIFAPALKSGDRLQFVLRANATKDRASISRMDKESRRGKSRRVDVVMDLMRETQANERRSDIREQVAQTAAQDWMVRQGNAKGFTIRRMIVEGYSAIELMHRRRGARFGILDLHGEIEVTEPTVFLRAVSSGFGRAKAWGCGLMLIRRA